MPGKENYSMTKIKKQKKIHLNCVEKEKNIQLKKPGSNMKKHEFVSSKQNTLDKR